MKKTYFLFLSLSSCSASMRPMCKCRVSHQLIRVFNPRNLCNPWLKIKTLCYPVVKYSK